MTEISPIKKACNVVGSQRALAAILGVTPQALGKWIKKESVPSARVIEVEAATDGAVTRHQLRPDIYPDNT